MLHLSQISKTFNAEKPNEIKALQQVDVTINTQDFVVMIGANGSGKTTLLNIIAGAEIGSEGKVLLNNLDITNIAEHQRSKWIARVFQNPLSGTAPNLSIIENFRLAALRTKSKTLQTGINTAFEQQVKEKISWLQMGLENKINLPMATLSGGQRQALTLLMSVMDDTQLLLLDEPTAALDPKTANTVLQIAQQLITHYKLTAILITHNLKDALQYGNRLIRMHEGKIATDLNAEQKQQLTQQQLMDWFM